jgi:hypothetical protein
MIEVELLDRDFITKVVAKRTPIDYRSYEQSQINVQGIIAKLMRHRSSAKRKKDIRLWSELHYKIGKLREIEKDLQKALEL